MSDNHLHCSCTSFCLFYLFTAVSTTQFFPNLTELLWLPGPLFLLTSKVRAHEARISRAHPSPTRRREPPALARCCCWKHSTWQPPAQGFSLLAVAARCSPGERLGREQLQMQLSAPLSQECRPAPAEAPALPCRQLSEHALQQGLSCWQPCLGSLPGSLRQHAMCLAALLDSSWPVSAPTSRAACRVWRSCTAGTKKQSQAVSKCQYFCFPFIAIMLHSFAFSARVKGLPFLCIKALDFYVCQHTRLLTRVSSVPIPGLRGHPWLGSRHSAACLLQLPLEACLVFIECFGFS